MDNTQAQKIAEEWWDAWNQHDLNAIMSHYSENIVFTSPLIIKITGESSGTLQGKSALRKYFSQGLAAYPDLKFKPLSVFTGVNSLVAHYESVGNRGSAEVMELDENGKICRVLAHYQEKV
jgi:hypothetical protein